MKKSFTLLFFCVIFVTCSTIYTTAQTRNTLHAILIIDTKSGFEPDLNVMNNIILNDIAESLNYDYNKNTATIIKSGKDFNGDKVNKAIENLNVQDNDIVVFYYAGHGHNNGINKYPILSFDTNNITDDYSLSKIINSLDKKATNAKLILYIADCCNVLDKSPTRGSVERDDRLAHFENREKIRNLFTDFLGKRKIIMLAAEQGHPASTRPNGRGVFSLILQNTIYDYTRNDSKFVSPTWEEVLQETVDRTGNGCYRSSDVSDASCKYEDIQVPMCEISDYYQYNATIKYDKTKIRCCDIEQFEKLIDWAERLKMNCARSSKNSQEYQNFKRECTKLLSRYPDCRKEFNDTDRNSLASNYCLMLEKIIDILIQCKC